MCLGYFLVNILFNEYLILLDKNCIREKILHYSPYYIKIGYNFISVLFFVHPINGATIKKTGISQKLKK